MSSSGSGAAANFNSGSRFCAHGALGCKALATMAVNVLNPFASRCRVPLKDQTKKVSQIVTPCMLHKRPKP